ncbi:MAG TPA: hypothetical protein VM369_08010 [Candidatus Binatia bacterium]|nr:hypothetical protein [Candidatus Binatia bacterium]
MKAADPAALERLRRRAKWLLRAYVLHVGWFGSTCAFAAADAGQMATASCLWMALVSAVPVLVHTVMADRAIRAIEPAARSAGLKQVVLAMVLFTPFEAALIPPAINLWIARRILRRSRQIQMPGREGVRRRAKVLRRGTWRNACSKWRG